MFVEKDVFSNGGKSCQSIFTVIMRNALSFLIPEESFHYLREKLAFSIFMRREYLVFP